MCHEVHTGVKGHRAGVCLLLPPWGPRGSNSGHQACVKCLYPLAHPADPKSPSWRSSRTPGQSLPPDLCTSHSFQAEYSSQHFPLFVPLRT